jgi:hypothetical protein
MNVDGNPVTARTIVFAVAIVLIAWTIILMLGLTQPVHG